MSTIEENGPRSSIDLKIGDCGIYEHGKRRPGRLPFKHAYETARATDGFVWIGLQQATAEEVAEVAAEFHLPPLAVEDAILAHQRPKLEVYGEVVFAVLKPVRYVDHDEIVEVSEIAVFVGRNFVVTVRHGESRALAQVRAELDAGSDLLQLGPTAVLYRAADLVVDGYEHALVSIDEDVDEIESQFLPWLMDGVEARLNTQAQARAVRHAGRRARGSAGMRRRAHVKASQHPAE